MITKAVLTVLRLPVSEPKNFREGYPAPWSVEETPSGYCVKGRCGTEGLALGKAIAALAMPAQTDASGARKPGPFEG